MLSPFYTKFRRLSSDPSLKFRIISSISLFVCYLLLIPNSGTPLEQCFTLWLFFLSPENGIIKSDKVFEVMLATDRCHYAKCNPYMDSPQSIGMRAFIWRFLRTLMTLWIKNINVKAWSWWRLGVWSLYCCKSLSQGPHGSPHILFSSHLPTNLCFLTASHFQLHLLFSYFI